MRDPRHISPLQALLGQLLLFSIMVGLTVLSLDMSLKWSLIAFTIAIFVIGWASYLVIYHPRVSLEDQKKQSFLKHYLELVVDDFSNQYDTEYDVRANVMIPYRVLSIGTRRRIIPIISYDRYLKIWSWAGGGEDTDIEPHEEGSADETELMWGLNPPEGNCGRAFVNRQVRTAGRDKSDGEWTGEELTSRQVTATQQVNSVLSAPIRKPDQDEPIAVFNLDAAATIEETNFTEDSVKRTVAEEYAEPIGTIL